MCSTTSILILPIAKPFFRGIMVKSAGIEVPMMWFFCGSTILYATLFAHMSSLIYPSSELFTVCWQNTITIRIGKHGEGTNLLYWDGFHYVSAKGPDDPDVSLSG